MAIPHEGAPFLGMKRSAHGLPESIQGRVGHLQNMEFVHDYGDPGQGLPNGILVGTPHVDGHASDPPPVGKIRKKPSHRGLVPIWKHLDHIAGRNVREDRPGSADEMHLVDPQNFGCLEPKGVLEILGVVVEDLPDGEGPDSRLFGQLAKGVAEGFLLKPGFEPGRHEPLVVHGGKRLIERPSAGLAAEAPGIDGNPDPFPVNGEVPDPLLPASEADQGTGPAMDASLGRRDYFGLDLIATVSVLGLENTVGGKIQEIRKASHLTRPLSALKHRR